MAGDATVMANRLAVISYYRLAAYWHPFRQSDDTFKPGTHFDTVWTRYVFDRHLRLHLLDALERIEVAVRSQLALHHSQRYNPFAYANDPASVPRLDQRRRQRFQNELVAEFHHSEEMFVQHFKHTYGDEHRYLPVWMACEIMSFGCMLTFFRGCQPDIQRRVAQTFGVHHKVLESWLLALNVIRNVCAHHSRLWNRVLGIKPKIPDKDDQWHTPVAVGNDRVFGILTICKYCMDRIAPQSRWPHRFQQLLERFDGIPLDAMGIEANWLDCPIWSSWPPDEAAGQEEASNE